MRALRKIDAAIFKKKIGIPVFAYTDCLHARAARPLIERIPHYRDSRASLEASSWRDLSGNQIEDFGLAENLMIACEIEPDVAPSAAIAITRCARHLRYLRARTLGSA